MFRLIPILLLAAVLAGPAQAQLESAAADPPRWPLDLGTRYLTSNFMEYRPGRFHAGLDLKTQTVCGFAARAVEDGWIVRLRATPSAYGRAVYLRGASGRTYVYAHLSRFSDRLRQRIVDQQQRGGTYRARLQFKPGELRVKQGEVLGLTGQSGTAGPHLHFEVRDPANRPIDPQAAGFAVGDTIAPVIHSLRAWPVRPDVRIQSDGVEHLLTAAGGLHGQLPALQSTGPVAFSARIVDRSDIRGHRLEPHLIEVYLDDELVYRCRNERYEFGDNALQRLEWLVVPGVRERWLHRHPDNTLAGREGSLWYLGSDGGGLEPGRHRLRISAADLAGNRTSVDFELEVLAAPEGPAAPETAAWIPDVISPTIMAPDSLSHIVITPFFDQDSEAVRAAYPDLRRRAFTVAAGAPVLADLVVYSHAIALTPEQRQAAADQGLHPLGKGRDFVAATWPIAASLPVQMAAPAASPGSETATWGLYRWQGTSWQHAAVWPESGGDQVYLGQPGLHAVLADHSPPLIGVPDVLQVASGPQSTVEGVTLPRWAVLPVPLRDLGSGLAAASISVHLDGQKLIVEPDLPRDRILVEFPDAMAPGTHRLAVAASDQAGHDAAREIVFAAIE